MTGNMQIACPLCGRALGLTTLCSSCLNFRTAFYRDSRGHLPRYRVRAWRTPNEDGASLDVKFARAEAAMFHRMSERNKRLLRSLDDYRGIATGPRATANSMRG